jgi:hypothetical protein
MVPNGVHAIKRQADRGSRRLTTQDLTAIENHLQQAELNGGAVVTL